jgi:hypothetical protein
MEAKSGRTRTQARPPISLVGVDGGVQDLIGDRVDAPPLTRRTSGQPAVYVVGNS